MSVFPTTCIFMIRDLCRGVAGTLRTSNETEVAHHVAVTLGDLFKDHSAALVAALRTGNTRAWRALEVALAGDGGNRLGAAARPWLAQAHYGGAPFDPAQCLEQLRAARRAGVLDAGAPSAQQVAGVAGQAGRYLDTARLLDGQKQTLSLLAGALKSKFPEVARLLTHEATQPDSLLAAAARYFFHRAFEANATLVRALGDAHLETPLPPAEEQALAQLDRALSAAGDRLDAILDGTATATEVPTNDQPTRQVPTVVERSQPVPAQTPQRVESTPSPASTNPAVAEVEQLLGRLQQRADSRDLEQLGTLLRRLRAEGDPAAPGLVRRARQVLQKHVPADAMTFLPRGDGRATVIAGRAAALAWSIQFSLWDDSETC